MADLTFAMHTRKILDMLPHWFKLRKASEDSIGARFLNIAGLELDDLRYVIDYAYEQCYINTADITQVDFCYKTIIPMPYKSSDIQMVFSNNVGLIPAKNLKQFFGIDQNGIKDVTAHSFQFYFLDEERNILYVRQKFNIDAVNDNGKIRVVFKDGTEKEFKEIPHHVWNFFDELGALVCCERIFEEPNVEYKERIMDVFKNHANASRHGLINGIGRELACRRNIHWKVPTHDIELEDAMIVLNSIIVNGEPVDSSRIFLSETGTVIVKGYPEWNWKKEPHCVLSYVYGLEMHQLWNKDDVKLQNELFTVEGKCKSKLREYINILNAESPIFWDHFHWNEHYWDQNEADVSGVGYIPHLYDGSIQGFRSYGIV